MEWIKTFQEITLADLPEVGGKNASLGEMFQRLARAGVRVPDGFAVTADAYREFLRANGLWAPISLHLTQLRRADVTTAGAHAAAIRALILAAPLPETVAREVTAAYRALSAAESEKETDVAVRSSATAEDLPDASFAGQQETFLHVRGEAALLDTVRRAFASLFTLRAIHYRAEHGFRDEKVALSVGVQKMVRSGEASAGVVFTLDPDSGHSGIILVTSAYGLGEGIVQGTVAPDQFWVHKEALRAGHPCVFRHELGAKEARVVPEAAHAGRVHAEPVSEELRARPSISREEVLELAKMALAIEAHYSALHGTPTPMDIEWAKDGAGGALYIVQARPETVHSQRAATFKSFRRTGEATALLTGTAVGDGVAWGPTRVVTDARRIAEVQDGDVIVTTTTDPDWEPVLRKASAIITERGGRTSHAAIVAREIGIPAVVGATGATAVASGLPVTVSCAEGEVGKVYGGHVAFDIEEVDASSQPPLRTRVMINVGTPERALGLARLPCDGVGLARMEFIFASWIGIHPLALLQPDRITAAERAEIATRAKGYADPSAYFIGRLSEGIATLAAAFHPRPVILRFSDFKSNEYARLLGGKSFEPQEENPMLGWRGASRYYHPDYRAAFLLEVEAVLRVRRELGLTNLHVMVPFCRTPLEGKRVLEVMANAGLRRGDQGLQVYVMAEIPSNVILAADFAALFDGFSIGSNDLTQLTLGVDRDAALVAPLFDERNEAVKWSCAHLIEVAHEHGCTVGICGQAPSDYPEFAAFLVERHIDSISLTPDAFLRTRRQLETAERAADRRADEVSADQDAHA